jgi:sugar lactone lactonase YvrE
MAVGLAVDSRTQYLYVAGGLAKNLRVYDLVTGDLVNSYTLSDATFPNDLVVTANAVYVTDSFSTLLFRLPLNEAGLYQMPLSEVSSLPEYEVLAGFPLLGDYAVGDMSYPFQANGIVAATDGQLLVIVNSNTGMLYRVDTATTEARAIDLGGQTVPFGDGLVLDGNLLYVVQNYINKVSVVELNAEWTAGSIVAEITSPEFSVPTTAIQWGNSLYVVNGRYEESEPLSADAPEIGYELIRVNAVMPR